MKIRLLIPLVTLVLGATPVVAHHAFSAEFDANSPVKLTGTLTKIEMVNPHGWIYIDVKNADGTVSNWAVETVAPNQLYRRGLRKEDFPIGTQVNIEGYQAKNGKPIANGRGVTFLDGRNFFLGATEGGPEK